MGFNSPALAHQMLGSGGILNCPLLPQDIERGIAIAGMPKGYHEGKMHDRKAAQIKAEWLPPTTKKQQIAHCDIMHCGRRKYFVAVVNPLNMAIAVALKNSKAPEIKRAISAMTSILSFRDITIHTIVHDPEKAIAAVAGMFPGIIFEATDVNGHVVLAERLIEQLKEIMRSVIHSLPFDMPEDMIDYLVSYAVIRRNSVWSKAHGMKMSAREAFMGRKLNYKTDLKFGFGDFAKVYNPKVRKNTMQRRTMDAIALYPTGGLSGAWVFWHIKTQRPIVRSRAIAEPMSDAVVALLNDIAARGAPVQLEDSVVAVHAPPEQDVDGLNLEPELVTADPHFDLEPGVEVAGDDLGVDSDDAEEEVAEPMNEAGSQVVWIGDEYIDEEFGPQLNLLMEAGVHDDVEVVEEEPMEQNLTKVTRSGRIYAASVRAKVLTATKRLSMGKALKLHKSKAMDSMFAELSVLDEKGTFNPVDPNSLSKQDLKHIIRSFMFLTEKYNSQGEFVKLKSRLVAMGNEQDRDTVDMEVSSPTVASSSVYAVAAIAAVEGRHVLSGDIGAAFLNAYIPAGVKILVRLDKVNSELLCQLRPEYRNFLNQHGEITVKLDRALYGCVQSARLWYNTFCVFLESLGFVANERDKCVFNKVNEDGKQCTICFHVDDVMATCIDQNALDEIERQIKREYENVTFNHGTMHSYLGRLFDFSEKYKCKVTMGGFMDRLLSDEDVTGVVATPAVNELFNINDKALSLSPTMAKRFYSVVQRLLYLSVQFRRDIGVAVSFLTTRVRNPSEDDWKKLQRTLMYLNGTRNLSLRFGGDDSGEVGVYV